MTSYLLDTNILYWSRLEVKRLPKAARALLEDSAISIAYSVVSPWELAIKQAKGKLPVPEEFYADLSKLGFGCLPVEEKHIATLRTLPLLHNDPFDRMLVAQAKAEKLTLITFDKRLAQYPIKTLMCAP